MSYEEKIQSISLDADSSIGIYTGVPGQPGSASPNGGKQYHFLKVTGTHQVGLATAGADITCGILQNKPQGPGHAATVGIFGVSNVVVAGPLAAGVLVGPDAAGKAVADATNGRWQTLKAATAANELVPALRVR